MRLWQAVSLLLLAAGAEACNRPNLDETEGGYGPPAGERADTVPDTASSAPGRRTTD